MLRLSLWSLLAVVALELSINTAFKSPDNNVPPGKLQQYFNYGRSIENKMIKMVGSDDSAANSLAKSGWLETKTTSDQNPPISRSKQQVFVYGMSFSNHIGEILAESDTSLEIQLFAGPAAPLNHSYSYYDYHRPHGPGDIVILGILASSLPRINTLTHMTANFEGPAAYFYPRYHLDKSNRLVKEEIPIYSLADLRRRMHNRAEWESIRENLSRSDSFYDSILFNHNLSDESVYARLLKRAWGQKKTLETIHRFHGSEGFKNTERMVEVAQSLVSDFARKARADQALPYVILFNDRGYDDHLYRILEPVLKRDNIAHYSTHRHFPATQLSNFIPDGHFTPEIDHSIAAAVLQDIRGLKTL